MKKIVIFAILVILAACGNKEHEHFETVDESAIEQQQHKPTLDAKLEVKDTKAILSVKTDIKISKENYGKEKKEGEGHIHVYVNHGEKQGVAIFPYELKEIKPGENIVRISLHNNDHTPYGVSQEIMFEIPEE